MMSLISRLAVRQVELWVFLGWPEEERQEKQRILVDMEFVFEKPPTACQSDQLEETVCYAELIEKLDHFLQTQSFRLLEHLGKVIYDFIKDFLKTAPSAIYCSLTVTKFPAISNLLKGASFTYGDRLPA